MTTLRRVEDGPCTRGSEVLDGKRRANPQRRYSFDSRADIKANEKMQRLQVREKPRETGFMPQAARTWFGRATDAWAEI